MAVLGSDVADDHSGALDGGGFEDGDPGFVTTGEVFGDTVVADQGGGEDEDLTEVGRVRHGFRVYQVRTTIQRNSTLDRKAIPGRLLTAGDTGTKHRLPKHAPLGTKRLSLISLARL